MKICGAHFACWKQVADPNGVMALTTTTAATTWQLPTKWEMTVIHCTLAAHDDQIPHADGWNIDQDWVKPTVPTFTAQEEADAWMEHRARESHA